VVFVAVSCPAFADEITVDAASGDIAPQYEAPWPESAAGIGEDPPLTARCRADDTVAPWHQELLDFYHSTYPGSADSGKRLIGVAMSVAPRPNGEHYHAVLDSLPDWMPVLFHSRLNHSVVAHPRICAEVRAIPEYPQLVDPEKLNRKVDYRATHVTDSVERTRWRSNIVLDVSRTLDEAQKLFHYVLYVEDDVSLRPVIFDRIPEIIRGRIRMDHSELFQQDLEAGKLKFLSFPHKDPQDHKYADGSPWTMLWLSRQVCLTCVSVAPCLAFPLTRLGGDFILCARCFIKCCGVLFQGMLATIWDARYLAEAVDTMRARFDEKPVDWLVRQIKFDKGWNTPSLAHSSRKGFVNHLGAQSTLKSDKRKRAVGSI